MALSKEQIRVGEREMSLSISCFFEFWTVCMLYSFIKPKDRERSRCAQVHTEEEGELSERISEAAESSQDEVMHLLSGRACLQHS